MSTQDGKFWEKAWNPIHVKGGGYFCSKVSPGCRGCWSEALNLRFGNGLPFDNRKVEFELDQRILEQPLHWKKPRVIATCWLGDLFHEQIPDELRNPILSITTQCPQHRFLVLTKRAEMMNRYINKIKRGVIYPDFNNLWLGLSICTQQEADEKIPILLQIPAAHRFVNFEPLLEAVRPWDHEPDNCPTWYDGCNCQEGIDWVLLGTESGPGRRPMKLEWARSIAEQCRSAEIPFWIKQIEVNGKVSKDMADWPADLRIRELPF